MRVAVDTSVLVAILLEEPEADTFLRIMARNEPQISGHVLIETVMVLAGRSVPDPVGNVDQLLELSACRHCIFDENMARKAQQAFLDYGKGRHPARLNFGDCMSYAVAKALNVPLLWKGNDFDLTDVERAF